MKQIKIIQINKINIEVTMRKLHVNKNVFYEYDNMSITNYLTIQVNKFTLTYHI